MFNSELKSENKLYKRFRNAKIDDVSRIRLESLWERYCKYAPKGFSDKLQVDFSQRWWEMYCGVGLLNLGFEFEGYSIDEGPDFQFNLGNKKCYVEAIAPKLGTGKDKLSPLTIGVNKLPEDEFLLRLRSGIAKKASKFNKYINEGVVNEDDILIIAISSCDLGQYGTLMDFPVPAIYKILKDVGNLGIDIESGRKFITKRAGIEKKSGYKFDSNNFLTDKSSHISAVIYSSEDPLNALRSPENSFIFIRNDHAKTFCEYDFGRELIE